MTIMETTETRTVVPTFTLKASVLRDALHVHVAAGRDDTLPTLTGVHVSWTDGEPIVFAATDRYRLAIATVGEAGSGDGVFLLPRRDAIELIKVLPKAKRNTHDPDVVVTVTKDHVTVFMVHYGSTFSKEYRTLDGQFPKYRSLLPKTDPQPISGIAWNPAYMADVAKLPIARYAPVKWSFYGETRPMVGRFRADDGTDWEYLLMPVRLA
jgi:DNA polymerase III sliding clamp (beta) subunit (PCNA family)